jgi:glycosyltransferase involved in cell wall biosynthesis
MEKVEELSVARASAAPLLALSVIVPVRNEAANLSRCLASLQGVGEVCVVDSQSSDRSVEIAESYGAKVVQFHYAGGWPKKRQWALDTLPLQYDWTFLIDADEAMTPALAEEICEAIANPGIDGYFVGLQMYFLGRKLLHCGATFHKLSLFRRGKGRFECRLRDQDASMADMEVHEHVIVRGTTAQLKNSLVHYNTQSLSRYIQKHDEYSNWDATLVVQGRDAEDELPPSFSGTQAQRRRWLRKKLFNVPGSPLMFFLYKYFFRLGFLDGVPGLIYCCFQGIQFFHIKSKAYELRNRRSLRDLQVR